MFEQYFQRVNELNVKIGKTVITNTDSYKYLGIVLVRSLK